MPAKKRAAAAHAGQQPAAERKPRTVKTYAALDLNGMDVAALDPGTDMSTRRRSRGERSAEQRYVDDLVQNAYARWQQSGRSFDWTASAGLALTVASKEQVDTLQFMIRKAGVYFSFRIRFGELDQTPDGRIEVPFIATDFPPEAPKNTAPQDAVPNDGPILSDLETDDDSDNEREEAADSATSG